MTGEGGVGERRPRLRLDHVLIAAGNLIQTARRLEREYGLSAVAGGVHPRAGTANMIIPMGDSYLELITVVDRSAASGVRAQRVSRALRDGRTFVAWAVRSDDLEATAHHLAEIGLEMGAIEAGERLRPDGSTLRWRSLEVEPCQEATPFPFCIQWEAMSRHPGGMAIAHRSQATEVTGLLLGHPRPSGATAQLELMLGGDVRFDVRTDDRPGLLELTLASPGGAITIR